MEEATVTRYCFIFLSHPLNPSRTVSSAVYAHNLQRRAKKLSEISETVIRLAGAKPVKS